MTQQSQRDLDALDWRILRELQTDARLSYNELSRRVGLSSPAVAERVRKMEDAGIITGYRAEVDPSKVGLPVMALVQLRCHHGKCLLMTAQPEDFPEIIEVLKVSGPYCTVLKVVASSVAHLEAVFDRIYQYGESQSSMVWSTALNRRVIDWEGGIPDFEMPSFWQKD